MDPNKIQSLRSGAIAADWPDAIETDAFPERQTGNEKRGSRQRRSLHYAADVRVCERGKSGRSGRDGLAGKDRKKKSKPHSLKAVRQGLGIQSVPSTRGRQCPTTRLGVNKTCH